MFTSFPGSTWILQTVAAAFITNIKDLLARSARSANVSDVRVSRLNHSYLFFLFCKYPNGTRLNCNLAPQTAALCLRLRESQRIGVVWIITFLPTVTGGLHIPPTPHRRVRHLSSSGPFLPAVTFSPFRDRSLKTVGWRFSIRWVQLIWNGLHQINWVFNNDILK